MTHNSHGNIDGLMMNGITLVVHDMAGYKGPYVKSTASGGVVDDNDRIALPMATFRETPPLQKVGNVRHEFPETWLWLDRTVRYTEQINWRIDA